MDPKETGYEDVDWIEVAQDKVQGCAFVSTVMNILVP
jgi:hypothetical protein